MKSLELQCYLQIFEKTPEAIAIITADNRILQANPAFSAMVAMPLEHLKDLSLGKLVLDRDLGSLTQSKPTSFEVQLRTGHGIWKTVKLKTDCLYDNNNKVIGLVLFCLDLTEQLATQFYFRESEARFRAIFDFAPMGLIQLDEDGYYVKANQSFQKLLGYSEEQLKKMKIFQTLHPDENSDLVDGRLRLRTSDEQTTWVHITRSVLPDNEGAHEVLIVEDLREQVAREEERERQRQILLDNAKMASLGQMSAGVAHEINNPLAVVNTRIHLLRKGAKEKQALDHLEVIERNTKRIQKIVQGLKTYSRQSSSDPFTRIAISLLVEDVMSLVEGQRDKADFKVQMDLRDPKAEIQCRPAEISQVLVNLLGNACDAVQGLSEKWVRLQITESANAVEFRVIDSGHGIPADIAQKLFDPFFTTKEVGKGTGLGLSIAAGIVKHHKGKLWIDTECQNTCFIVHLPKSHSSTQAA